MRRCVGIEAARLAARRADARARARIAAAAQALVAHDGDPSRHGDRTFWAEVVDASDNLAFRLAFNSLIDAVDAQPELMAVLLEADRDDGQPHAELARAIGDRDAERAAQVADVILSQALTTLERLPRRRPPRSA